MAKKEKDPRAKASKHNSTSTKWYRALIYDTFLWCFTIVVDLFFREIHPRTSYRIPRTGPVIFVCAPHANQFVDPLLLMRTVKSDAQRRIAFLIAEKSLRRKFIGALARSVDSVSVGRALDMKRPAQGRIYLPDPEGDPTLVRGTGTDFTAKEFMVGGLLVLPSVNNTAANAEIKEVLGQEEIRLKKAFKGHVAYRQLTGRPLEGEEGEGNGHLGNGDVKGEAGKKEGFDGISFNVAPHIDQGAVYEAVFQRLGEGGCIGIFPEGGSHDRTELLPLKAGVAVMALGAMADDPTTNVKIVPVGMNYFHAHKFRSRAVIEFGKPIEPTPEQVEEYKNGNKREATGQLLDSVFNGLRAVTTLAPDYDTLMLIQAVRRLYNPKGKKLPLSMVVELNRRLMKGYETYKDDPRIVSLRKEVLDYNRTLFRVGIRDHQVGYAKHPWYKVVFLLFYRTFKLAFLAIAVLPGTVLFAPVFVAGKLISIAKAKEALAASSVKIRARDVIATWKILVALALTPALDLFYSCIAVWWTWYSRVHGWVPAGIPLWLIFVVSIFFCPAMCFMALRFGEVGMDIAKSLRPLMLTLYPSERNTLTKLKSKRDELTVRIDGIINELGPELFPDFDAQRIIQDPNHPLHEPERRRQQDPDDRPTTPTHQAGGEIDALQFTPATPPPLSSFRHNSTQHLPRNDSFKNLGSIGLFATRPGTPNRSRSRTNSGSEGFGSASKGFGFGFTSMDEGGGGKRERDMEEVSRNLHAAMRERGRRRGTGEWGEADGEEDGDREGEGEGEEKKRV